MNYVQGWFTSWLEITPYVKEKKIEIVKPEISIDDGETETMLARN